jgi:hypothetical protein
MNHSVTTLSKSKSHYNMPSNSISLGHLGSSLSLSVVLFLSCKRRDLNHLICLFLLALFLSCLVIKLGINQAIIITISFFLDIFSVNKQLSRGIFIHPTFYEASLFLFKLNPSTISRNPVFFTTKNPYL